MSRSYNRKEASQGMKIGARSQREEGSNIFPLTCGQIPAELFLLSIPGSATVLSADSQCFRSESEQSTEDKSHLWYMGYTGAWRTYSSFKNLIACDNPTQLNFHKLKSIIIQRKTKMSPLWKSVLLLKYKENTNLFFCICNCTMWLNSTGIF